jgi:hypothetical protein
MFVILEWNKDKSEFVPSIDGLVLRNKETHWINNP